jgi:hypothetical protein
LTSLIGWAQVQPRSDHHACFLMKASPTMLWSPAFVSSALENPKVMLRRPQQLHYNIVWPPWQGELSMHWLSVENIIRTSFQNWWVDCMLAQLGQADLAACPIWTGGFTFAQ